MTVDESNLPEHWHRAKQQFSDHLDSENGPGCSFGGMSMGHWYWLTVERCNLSHGDKCQECGKEAAPVIRWRDYAATNDGIEMWELAFCEEHLKPLKPYLSAP